MIFEFLVVVHLTEGTDVKETIYECLFKVLDDNLNEFDSESIKRMIVLRAQREGNDVTEENSEPFRRMLIGFALDLPEETASMRTVVDEFAEALKAPPVVHVVKFEDPLIRVDLARWAEEIYALEMKLRRVLTLVYLHAYRDCRHYELLREETVQPMNKDQFKPNHMELQAENEFFHLTFGQYVGLNSRPEFKLAQLLTLIRCKDDYDHLRQEVVRAPVEDEDDAVLLAGLKERMDAIEAIRNCCAHSRRPSKKVIANYINARPLLDQLLDDYLTRWEWQEPEAEMPWDAAAREAVEVAMKGAQWDKDKRTITLFDHEGGQMRQTAVASREELEKYLCEVAQVGFYRYAPHDDGDFVFDCDDDEVVWTVLSRYEEMLNIIFGGNA